MTQEFNPSSFTVDWNEAGDLVVNIQGADPDGIQTVKWHYDGTDGTKGTNGTINGPYANDDGTATVTVEARHFPGTKANYQVTASQTLGPPQTPGTGV
jgi:hypothetical protein